MELDGVVCFFVRNQFEIPTESYLTSEWTNETLSRAETFLRFLRLFRLRLTWGTSDNMSACAIRHGHFNCANNSAPSWWQPVKWLLHWLDFISHCCFSMEFRVCCQTRCNSCVCRPQCDIMTNISRLFYQTSKAKYKWKTRSQSIKSNTNEIDE